MFVHIIFVFLTIIKNHLSENRIRKRVFTFIIDSVIERFSQVSALDSENEILVLYLPRDSRDLFRCF